MVLVVENFESFSQAEDYRLPESIRSRDPLIVFRGDTQATPAAVVRLLKSWLGSVVAFGDFDPAGILYALSLPSVEQLIVPEFPHAGLAKMSVKGRFHNQYDQWCSLAKRHEVEGVPALLQEMKRDSLAIPQEAMHARNVSLETLEVSRGKSLLDHHLRNNKFVRT
ncbi:hypothetical protein P8631_08370 [Guyparkeria sp. 1SP6A2]|nr:hypothetical protein [Guyparkeria sp. 1SP6A2]